MGAPVFRTPSGDPRVINLIRRWLKAGVLEDGAVHPSDEGTPQGGSISVLLSNLYLHHVLDLWFERVVKCRLRGEARLVRYIDDFVICFQFGRPARTGCLTFTFQNARFQPTPDQIDHARITDSVFDKPEYPFMIEVPRRSSSDLLQHPPDHATSNDLIEGCQGTIGTEPRSAAK